MPVREDVLEGGDRHEGDRRGLFGLIGGVVAGLMLSEIIGIVGYLVFDSAVVAPSVDARFRRWSEQPLYRRNQRRRP